MPSDQKEHIAVPNWEVKCINCDQLPTVDIYHTVGKGALVEKDYSTELCGVCCWGESKLADPSEW